IRQRNVSGHPGSFVGILEAELVAKPRRLLVIFARDGVAQEGAESEPLARVGTTPRDLADVPGRAVGVTEHGEQAAREDPVVERTAEPPSGPELHELQAAIGAGQAGELADQLADVRD